MKSKSRILYINPFSGYGGAEQSLAGLLRTLGNSTDYELHLLLPDEGLLSRNLEDSTVQIHCIKPPNAFIKLSQSFHLSSLFSLILLIFSFPLYLYRLSSFIKKLDPVVIHTNGLKAHLLAGLLPMSLKGRVLLWHWRMTPSSNLVKLFLSVLSRRVTVCISNSDFLRKTVPATHAPVETVYNPIDVELYKPSNTASLCAGTDGDINLMLKDYPELEGKRIISVVSVLAPKKGIDKVISTLAPLLKESSDIRLVIVGDEMYDTVGHKGYRQKLESLANKVAPLNSIVFVGFQTSVTPWMSLSQICVHFPEAEAFGRVVAEALACETPVVAARVGGIPEIIDDGETGFLVELDDENALRKKVGTLLENEQLRQKMGKKGRCSVIERFSVEKHSQAVSEIYERFISNI